MRFGLLGPLAVWTDTGSPVAVPGVKVRALLAALLLGEGRPQSSDRLVEDVWAGRPPGQPAATLQAKVSQLRRALEDAEPGARDLVVSGPSGYLLRVEPDAVDAGRFALLTRRAGGTGDPAARSALLADALALWRGPALADFADEAFARPAVARLEEDRLVAVEQRAEARLALGEDAGLVGELGDLVARHPLRERLRAVQLRALYRAGRQSEALAGYAELRDRLADEQGLDPSPELVALQRAILAQDPALGPEPARPPAGPPPTNLPTPLTRLVGRAGAVAEISALLRSDRLVTLTGPGGVGKTRLAVEIATGLAAGFPDGAWLVELAALGRAGGRDGVDAVAAAAIAVLGVREDVGGPAESSVDRLAEALRSRRMLLVLDNCEHVVGPVSELVDLLLKAGAGLRVLATSQEPLGLAGETVRPVPPLELPAPDATPDELPRSSAVRLFVARAAAAAPDFALDAGNAAAVAELCRRLDGIPLALELAAIRVRALGVPELVARLDDRFRLLAAGHRGAPARQQTLRAVLDWSWELLGDAERAALRRLAVAADSCTLAAAEDICAGQGVGAEDVVDLLVRLVDRSMVVAVPGPDGTRYRMLESVADYCLDRLREAGELPAARRRHAEHHLALAEHAEEELHGAGQQRWLERLDRDVANLRAALDTEVADGRADRALRLVAALSWYWYLRGRLGEARRSLAAALAVDGPAPEPARAEARTWQAGFALLAGDVADPVVRAETAREPDRDGGSPGRALADWFLGLAVSDLGDLALSERLVERSLATFRARSERWGVAAALSTRTKHAMIRGDLAAVRRDGERSLALFREIGDRWGQLQASEWLGGLAEIAGAYDRGLRLHRDGLRMAEELGLWAQATDRLTWLGRIEMLRGDLPRARELLERAARRARAQGYLPGEVFAAMTLGPVARREGDLDEAERLLRQVLDRYGTGEVAAGPALWTCLAELGFVAELRGDADGADRLHRRALAVARELGDRRAVALALEGLAGARVLAGRPERAALLLGAAAAARTAAGAPLPAAERGDVDRIAAAARRALGAAAFDAAVRRGGGLDPDQAVS